MQAAAAMKTSQYLFQGQYCAHATLHHYIQQEMLTALLPCCFSSPSITEIKEYNKWSDYFQCSTISCSAVL